MDMTGPQRYERYRKHLTRVAPLGIEVDVSRMPFRPRFWSKMEPVMRQAFEAMDKLEAGAIANPDEGRMVGHYWLRAPKLAPNDQISHQITTTVDRIKAFAKDIHDKRIPPPTAKRFTDLLLIGIGGSALGPQLTADALGAKRDKMRLHFIDNTDPDGIVRTLQSIQTRLKSTLVLVISKSGGTHETRNGMIEAKAAFDDAGLDFARQAVAITGEDSRLDKQAQGEGWLNRFPMWDWVGGRMSVTSAVGLVPMALQGVDVDSFLEGAAEMDQATRNPKTKQNPAARLALMWHLATHGTGDKDMVVLPYKDRLILLSRYLQQLVMESLGKAKDRQGNIVHQGIAVYGNKGSTDQHAFVQQLRDGVDNFFATFIVVLQDTPRPASSGLVDVEEGIAPGDYLSGFWQGTRKALHENGRGSITITLDKLNPKTLGGLIALYERAVGLYAELVDINAYNQPGVEAGKKAAADVLQLQQQVVALLRDHPDQVLSPEEIAQRLDRPDDVETVLHICDHLAANQRQVKRKRLRYTYAVCQDPAHNV